MKKALIIVVIVAVVILAGLIFIGSTAKPQIQQAIQTDQTAAADINMKILTTQVMEMVLNYDGSNTGGPSFIKVPANVTALTAMLSQYQQKNGVSVAYSVLSTPNDELVKLQAAGANNFYCTDAIEPSAAVVVVPVSGENFTSSTDCTGQPIK